MAKQIVIHVHTGDSDKDPAIEAGKREVESAINAALQKAQKLIQILKDTDDKGECRSVITRLQDAKGKLTEILG